MEKKKFSRNIKAKVELEEVIERLSPAMPMDSTEDKLPVASELEDQGVKSEQSLDWIYKEAQKRLSDVSDYKQNADASERLASDEVSKTRKSKKPSNQVPLEKRRKIKSLEETWGESSGKSGLFIDRKSRGVMISFSLLIVAAIIYAIIISRNKDQVNGNLSNNDGVQISNIEDELSNLEMKVKLVSDVADQYLSATTVEEKCKYIYNSVALKDKIEKYYKDKGGITTMENYTIKNVIPVKLVARYVWEIIVTSEDLPEGESLHFYVRRDSEEQYKVDWKADVAYQDNDVNEFKKSRAKKSTAIKFKVDVITGETIYNWGFTEEDYNVLKLSAPNSDTVFWGYIKKDSPLSSELILNIESNIKNTLSDIKVENQFILKVRFLADSPRENDQYILIDDIVSKKWVNTQE